MLTVVWMRGSNRLPRIPVNPPARLIRVGLPSKWRSSMRSLFANLRQRMLRLAHAIREGIVVGGGGWAGRDVSRNADETRGRNDPGN